MSSRVILFIIALLSINGLCLGRIIEGWTYQTMFDKSDLVVIGKALSTKDTEERSMLRDITPAVGVIGVVTDFETRVVLKGSPKVTTFQLHHYRFESADALLWVNAPALLRLSGKHQSFLLFLVKEPDGRYAPVSGQTDPAALSVLELEGVAE